MLGWVAGRPAALVTFLDGMWIRRPSAAHCEALGEALARLHLAGADFPMRRRNALSVDGWRPLYVAGAAGADSVQPGLREAIEKELTLLEGAWPSGLPEGVIHADLFPDNVFFLGDQLSGLIDFYFACTDTLAYDVAICLNCWCFEPDHSYNVTKGRALLQGYVVGARALGRGARRAAAARARRVRCASCSRAWSTGSMCRPARWCARRTRWNISASCASTRRSAARATTGSTHERASATPRARRHLHRRRLRAHNPGPGGWAAILQSRASIMKEFKGGEPIRPTIAWS